MSMASPIQIVNNLLNVVQFISFYTDVTPLGFNLYGIRVSTQMSPRWGSIYMVYAFLHRCHPAGVQFIWYTRFYTDVTPLGFNRFYTDVTPLGFNLPSGKSAMPVKISASVIVVTNKLLVGWASNQVKTVCCGLSRMSSEITLVSRTIMVGILIKTRGFSHGSPWRYLKFYSAERFEDLVNRRSKTSRWNILIRQVVSRVLILKIREIVNSCSEFFSRELTINVTACCCKSTFRIMNLLKFPFKIFSQDYLVFGSDLGFRSHKLRFSRTIASTARSYSGKTFTHIKSICKTK